jgi:hypothetical protein
MVPLLDAVGPWPAVSTVEHPAKAQLVGVGVVLDMDLNSHANTSSIWSNSFLTGGC